MFGHPIPFHSRRGLLLAAAAALALSLLVPGAPLPASLPQARAQA